MCTVWGAFAKSINSKFKKMTMVMSTKEKLSCLWKLSAKLVSSLSPNIFASRGTIKQPKKKRDTFLKLFLSRRKAKLSWKIWRPDKNSLRSSMKEKCRLAKNMGVGYFWRIMIAWKIIRLQYFLREPPRNFT